MEFVNTCCCETLSYEWVSNRWVDVLVGGYSEVGRVKGIVVDRRLEDLALLFKDVILCCSFKTWSDMYSEDSLVLISEHTCNWLWNAVGVRNDGDGAVWDIVAFAFVVH